MSACVQKRTSRHARVMFALPLKAALPHAMAGERHSLVVACGIMLGREITTEKATARQNHITQRSTLHSKDGTDA
jgi:hypothetical protein